MDDFKAKEWNKQLETILNDEQKYENVKVVLTKLVGLDLYNAAGGEAIQNVLCPGPGRRTPPLPRSPRPYSGKNRW